MSKRTTRSLVMGMSLIGAMATPAAAQDPRMGNKLDDPSRKAINAIVDSARAQGIPVEPLNEKVYEGVGKGAAGPQIVVAVRSLAFDMASARHVLGPSASPDELKAAASAIHAGVPAVELGKLKKNGGVGRSLVSALTVMADIVSRGVPVGTATDAIRSMVGAGAKDKDINDFQRNVKADIDQGAPPAAAAETRARSTKPEPQNEDRENR